MRSPTDAEEAAERLLALYRKRCVECGIYEDGIARLEGGE